MSADREDAQGPVGLALIGAGTISHQYLTNLGRYPDVRVLAVTDLDTTLAASRAAEYGIPVSGAPSVALEHPDVEIIVNLTPPAAHVEVALATVAAGKHAWVEKPLGLDRAAGQQLLARAKASGVRIGGAPDTFLGAALQAARRLIDSGVIGRPLTALTLMQSPGPESWHPNPAFLYAEGAGPLFDMAPYYLTALVQSLGTVTRVSAMGSTAHAERVIGAGPRAGERFPVAVPTHVSALTEFAGGEVASSVYSFDSHILRTGFIEITGTEGTIALPDPNGFTGDARVCPRGGDDWEVIPARGPEVGRGVGVLELARAIRADREHRATGELMMHVLDAMVSIDEAVRTGTTVSLTTSATVPEPLEEDWDPFARTLF